jgi:diguanylate cyclase (GGDEF)-like protein
MLAGAAFVSACSVLIPGYGGPGVLSRAAVYVAAVVLGIAGWVCLRRPDRIPAPFWSGVPVAAVALIVGLNMITTDSSAGGQLFFLWPVLYAATFLRRRLIFAVLGAVLIGDAIQVFTLEDPDKAVSDLAALMIALTMATIIIVTLRERADTLLKRFQSEALEDQLTRLPNRRAFQRDAALATARARRSGEPLSLLTLDVDRFKSINDTWGHPAGDVALQGVASALRSVTRESDVVARLGGDEFVALLVDCDIDGATRVASALQAALAVVPDLPGDAPTLSVGAATMPYDATTFEELATESDAALYHAKVSGRNRIVSASDTRGRGAARGECPKPPAHVECPNPPEAGPA